MITLQQLQAEIGPDYLIEICEGLALQAKPEYPENDPELQQIRDVRQYMKQHKITSVANAIASLAASIASTSSSTNPNPANPNSKRKTKTAKEAKDTANNTLLQKQTTGQGSLVTSKTQITQANIQQGIKEGQQLAQQKARAMATAYLQTTTECYEAFAQSILGMEETLLQIGDEAILEALEGEETDFFALPPGEIAGSFHINL